MEHCGHLKNGRIKMKRWYIRGMMMFVALFGLLIGVNHDVSANELHRLVIDISLQSDGTAVVSERREMTVDEGTELYFTLPNLAQESLLDFSVEGYQPVDEWDIDASLEEKAGKYGVIDQGDGTYELAWGMGTHGQQSYHLTYSLSNLVKQLQDGQALYWNFDTFSDIPAESLTIRVKKIDGEPLSTENVNFWGFGFKGDIQLDGEEIIWTSTETASEGATLLLQFPEEFFDLTAMRDQTLLEQRQQALEGSDYDSEEATGTASSTDTAGHLGDDSLSGKTIALIIAGVIGGIGALLGGIFRLDYKFRQHMRKLGHILPIAELERQHDGLERSEPPLVDDYAGIAKVLHQLGYGHFEEIMQAYFMKWATQDLITLAGQKETSLWRGTMHHPTIQIHDYAEIVARTDFSADDVLREVKAETYTGTYEDALWAILMDAADTTGQVTGEALKKWHKHHAKQMNYLADYLMDYSEDYLEAEGYFRFGHTRYWMTKHETMVPSEQGQALVDHIVQFRQYLQDQDYGQVLSAFHQADTEAEAMIWSVLVGSSQPIMDYLEELSETDAHYPFYSYYYPYYYGAFGARVESANGLTSGGFSSATSPATGAGGTTGIGGGAGAGGGGGGGAR